MLDILPGPLSHVARTHPKHLGLMVAILLLSLGVPARAQVQLGSDINGSIGAGSFFGFSVSLSAVGHRVAIGGPNYLNTSGALAAGMAAVFEYDGAEWHLMGQPIQGALDDILGTGVALSAGGGRLAVGAPFEPNSPAAGYAQVFEWDGSSWVQMGADIVGSLADNDHSGYGLALNASGTRLAVGAHFSNAAGVGSGRTRIFQWDGTNWLPMGQPIDGEAAGDISGARVSLSNTGSRVAISSFRNDAAGIDAGSVRVFEWNGTTWNQMGTTILGAAAGDWFGRGVSLSNSGTRVAIGAPKNDDAGANAGQVSVHEWDGTDWILLGGVVNGNAAGDEWGTSVAISPDGKRLAAGAPVANLIGGYAREFEYVGGAWTQVGTDVLGEEPGDNSGWAVALSQTGSRLAIGAIYNAGADSVNQGDGHVRVFQMIEPDTTVGVPRPIVRGAGPMRLRPNPARRVDLAVEFDQIAGEEPWFELIDLQGRRLAVLRIDGEQAGLRTARLRHEAPLAPGLYFVRLTQGGTSATSRLVIVE